MHAISVGDVFRVAHLYQCIRPFRSTLAALDVKWREGTIEMTHSNAPVLPLLNDFFTALPRKHATDVVSLMQNYIEETKTLHVDARLCGGLASTFAKQFGDKIVTLGADAFTSSLSTLTPAVRQVIFHDASNGSQLFSDWHSLPRALSFIVCYIQVHNFPFGALSRLLEDA